jgi:sulfide dehydrogenase [flavocytochrome c] flavoprotein subunit
MAIDRRHFMRLAAASPVFSMAACASRVGIKPHLAHVVVIGGGFAGATAAKTLRLLAPELKVTLVEQNPVYMSCPTSNWALTGLKSIRKLQFNYLTLAKKYQIDVVIDKVVDINSDHNRVLLQQNGRLQYDRLIMAPGIDFIWDDIAGYDASKTDLIPHAWKAGKQTAILHQQLMAMPDNGTVVIVAPKNPYRCPPGPYERASLMAYYCQRYKPKAKILILDHKRGFSKQALFMQNWLRLYGFNSENSIIEWLSVADNPVVSVTDKRQLETDFGDRFNADVLNIIPRQKAGKLAYLTGLTDSSGWCPVNPVNSESRLVADIHVIGDAAIYPGIPKSAFAANSEAKACAFAIATMLGGRKHNDPIWMNTCYSLLSPDQAISVSMVYKLNAEKQIIKVKSAGGVSTKTDSVALKQEAFYARQWYQSITRDTFM